MAARTLHDFLDALYGGEDQGYLELRALPSSRRQFVAALDLARIHTFTSHANENVYFGVALRRTMIDGTAENCLSLPALFVDLDFKMVPIDEARRRVTQLALAPSCIVKSGGGVHLYWLLREPIDLTSPEARAETKSLLRRLAALLSADMASAEVARVLRLPETLNYKYDPPEPVVIAALDASRRYNPSEFDEWLPREPAPVSLLTEVGPIREGARNRSLTSLAGAMRRRGATLLAIEAGLLAENASQCVPPLDVAEVGQIARSVSRYAPAPPTATVTAPEGTLDLVHCATLLEETDEPHDWVVEDRLARGSVNLVAGKPKVGKSTLVRGLGFSVAQGSRWLGHRCQRGTVVYVALEDKRSEVRRHLRQLGATGAEPLRFLIGRAPQDLLAKLAALIVAGDAIDMLIIDTAQRLFGLRDANDYALVTAAFEPVLALARTHGTCIVLVHHMGKTARDGIDGVLGSTAWAASVDNVLTLNRTERYRVLSSVQRIGPDLGETVVQMDESTGAMSFAGSRALVDLDHGGRDAARCRAPGRRLRYRADRTVGGGRSAKKSETESAEAAHRQQSAYADRRWPSL